MTVAVLDRQWSNVAVRVCCVAVHNWKTWHCTRHWLSVVVQTTGFGDFTTHIVGGYHLLSYFWVFTETDIVVGLVLL